MPFFAIPGTYHVKGLSPDGDSIRFKATDPDHWKLLDGPAVRVDSKLRAQLRLEAIDALETHYRAGGKTWHQPKELANAATDRLLDLVGIKNVVWPASRYRVTSADDGTPGYILCRTTERYRRPVSFAYAGKCPYQPGAAVNLKVSTLRKSVNFRMLMDGLAYPTFYEGLFYDLRNDLAKATVQARRRKKGIWKHDRSAALTLKGTESVTDDHPIFPKLFRRLMTHYGENGTFDNFNEYLERRRERTVIVSLVHFTHFDNQIEQTKTQLKLVQPVENMVFPG